MHECPIPSNLRRIGWDELRTEHTANYPQGALHQGFDYNSTVSVGARIDHHNSEGSNNSHGGRISKAIVILIVRAKWLDGSMDSVLPSYSDTRVPNKLQSIRVAHSFSYYPKNDIEYSDSQSNNCTRTPSSIKMKTLNIASTIPRQIAPSSPLPIFTPNVSKPTHGLISHPLADDHTVRPYPKVSPHNKAHPNPEWNKLPNHTKIPPVAEFNINHQ